MREQAMREQATSGYPIAIGGDGQFAAARSVFTRAGFDDAEVARRLGIGSIYEFEARREGRPAAAETADAFELLVRLFMDSESAPREVVRRRLGDDGEAALRALGLLRDEGAGDSCRASVLLYPTEGFLVASDLPREVLPPDAQPGADIVYPAVTSGTGHFVGTIPRTPCDRFLELCGGTGIAALVASRFARHAWATDITARATHFADFNRRLNGITNVTAACGDLYEAVPGMEFDRIAAHPPYVASPEVTEIFRDGGEDGEQVTRGIIAGLPAHLRPGGTLHLSGAVTDRTGRRFERRVRELLGDAAGEFDVFFLSGRIATPAEHYLGSAMSGRISFAELERRVRLLERLEVESIVYGSLVVRRHARRGQRPLTARRASPTAGADEAAWLIEVEEHVADPAFRDGLLDRSLAVSPMAEVAVVHQQDEEVGWMAASCLLRASLPFSAEARLPPAAAELLTRLNGTRPAREVLATLRAESLIPPELDDPTAASLLLKLYGMGLVVDVAKDEG